MKYINITSMSFLAVLSLTACSSGPSDEDIKNLIEKETAQAVEVAENMVGDDAHMASIAKEFTNSMTPKIQDVSGTECQKSKNDTYDCTSTLKYEFMGSEVNETSSYRVKQVDGDWAIVN